LVKNKMTQLKALRKNEVPKKTYGQNSGIFPMDVAATSTYKYLRARIIPTLTMLGKGL
jgi:hypothetical protein